ncbi:MAG TPA: AMP-binding protein [Polyangiaceae bacterium]|nr:AMP-binding protein [Polyangiaceae bacterium]
MSSLFQPTRDALRPHPVVTHHLSGVESADTLSKDALAAYRAESLRAIVRRAYEGSSLYREKMDRAGVRPDDIAGPADLARLPLLTKDELRGDPWRLLACERRDVALIQVSTGTTGGEEIYMAHTWRDYVLHDLAPRYSRLFPAGPGDVCLNALPYEMSTAGLSFHKTFLEGCQATVIPAGKGGAYSTPGKTVKMIRDLRPTLMVTSPSWAITLAEEAAAAGLDLPALRLKRMWLTGEGCSPAFRGRVERLWGTTAAFFYGSLECGALGIECDAHDGYHLPEAHVLMEVVDPASGKVLPAGEAGEIVVTALLRYDTPILRFRTGDVGALDEKPCRCGVAMTRYHMRGRAVDQIRYRGRALSPVYLEELLMRMPEVGNWFQLVVPSPDAAVMKIRCELAAGVAPERGLAARLAAAMSAAAGLPFEIEIVDRLPRPTGKVARVVKE